MKRGRWSHIGPAWWCVVYVALLAASHGVMWSRKPAPVPSAVTLTEVWSTDRNGPVAGSTMHVASMRWGAHDVGEPPIILIHGSPGGLTNFAALGPAIASRGREVYAIDLPGFGWSSAWVRSYSPRAHAYALLAWLDAMGIDRGHVLGWSQGGGVAMLMSDIAPERVASMTLLGSVGLQETEGSGSYFFEHLKYAVGFAGLVVGGELVPHFGLLGSLHDRYAFICNFWETDQRPYRRIMAQTRVPTLILQGRRDPLVPAWGAELLHGAMPSSRLVMLNFSHFMPFIDAQVPITADYVVDHASRHDEPDVAPLTDELMLAPEPAPAFGAVGRVAVEGARSWAWWVLVVLIGAMFLVRAELAAVICASLVIGVNLDFGVAVAGLMSGSIFEAMVSWFVGRANAERLERRWIVRLFGEAHRGDWQRRLRRGPYMAMLGTRFLPERRRASALGAGASGVVRVRAMIGVVVGAALWAMTALVVAIIAMSVIGVPLRARFGTIGLLIGGLIAYALVRVVSRAVTWIGRQQLKASLTRGLRYEFWSPKVFYLPLTAWMAWLAWRYRGLLTFTCVNPGIANGGGTIGESKSEILAGFDEHDPRLLRCVVIEPDEPEAQVRRLDEILRHERGFSGFPVIVKPDAAQRGYGVRLVKDRDEAITYFRDVRLRSVAQAYHPGPHECGVLWTRHEEGPRDGRHGCIFSITRKHFQSIVGDGVHTLEELVLRDRRLRCQWRVFLRRFGASASRVLDEGESLRLSIAGNHAQGAKFLDGSDLITPGLEAAIDELCAGFRGIDAGELDYGRFDLRYESDEALARGEFAIVELNGAMAESTNIYDPSWTVVRAYATLFRQWATVYRLGAMRRAQGRAPMRVRDLLGTTWSHFGERREGRVSD